MDAWDQSIQTIALFKFAWNAKKMCGQGLGDSVGDSVLRQRRAASSSGTGTQEFLSPSAAEDS